jgi:hypothetical protein
MKTKFRNFIIGCLVLISFKSYCQPTIQYGEKSIVDYSHLNIITEINGDNEYHYGFVKDNTYYVLSYESNDEKLWGIEITNKGKSAWKLKNDSYRNIFLYQLLNNNVWTKVSDLIQIDYRKSNNVFNHLDYHKSNGGVWIINDKYILLFLNNIRGSDGIVNPNYFDYYTAIVILVPDNNGIYLSTRFESENPKLLTNVYNYFNSDDNVINVDYKTKTEFGRLSFVVAENGDVEYKKFDNNSLDLIKNK